MKTSIGGAIASAATAAVRSLGAAGAALIAARPPAAPRPAAPRPTVAANRETALIRIEVSVTR